MCWGHECVRCSRRVAASARSHLDEAIQRALARLEDEAEAAVGEALRRAEADDVRVLDPAEHARLELERSLDTAALPRLGAHARGGARVSWAASRGRAHGASAHQYALLRLLDHPRRPRPAFSRRAVHTVHRDARAPRQVHHVSGGRHDERLAAQVLGRCDRAWRVRGCAQRRRIGRARACRCVRGHGVQRGYTVLTERAAELNAVASLRRSGRSR